jgi:hypothetical protein
MADEVKKDVVSNQDGTGKEQPKQDEKKDEMKDEKKDETKSDEKKESGFSKWWKGTKAKVDSDMLESHIQSAYATTHGTFDVYNYEGGLFNGFSVNGEIVDGALIYWAKDPIKEFAVAVDRKDNKAYYVGTSEPVDLKVTYEGTDYVRKGLKATLDANVEEVHVVKADKRYFLYKGNTAAKK